MENLRPYLAAHFWWICGYIWFQRRYGFPYMAANVQIGFTVYKNQLEFNKKIIFIGIHKTLDLRKTTKYIIWIIWKKIQSHINSHNKEKIYLEM